MNWKKFKIHSENRYLHLLVLLVGLFFISPYMDRINNAFPVLHTLFFFIIILTLRAIKIRRSMWIFFLLVGGTSLACEIVERSVLKMGVHNELGLVTIILYLLFIVSATYMMIRRMFTIPKVTGDTIRGGIAVYLLIGYIFAILYRFTFMADPNAFNFANNAIVQDFIYFSFNTLTTLGLGDVYPVNKFAMVLTNLEACAGPLYLGVFVARMVGLHIVHNTTQSLAK